MPLLGLAQRYETATTAATTTKQRHVLTNKH